MTNKDKIIEEFYNKFAERPTSSAWYLDVERFLKLALSQQKEEIRGMVDEVEKVEPESNGRYNACREIKEVLDKL